MEKNIGSILSYSLLQLYFGLNTLLFILAVYEIHMKVPYGILTRISYIGAILLFGVCGYFLISFKLSSKASKLYCEPLDFRSFILTLKKVVKRGLTTTLVVASYFTFSFGIFEVYIIPSCGFFFFFILYFSLLIIMVFYFFNLKTKTFRLNPDFSLRNLRRPNRKILKLKSLWFEIKANYSGFNLSYLFLGVFGLVSFLTSKRIYLLFILLISGLVDQNFSLALFFGLVQILTGLSLNLKFLDYIETHFGPHAIRKLGFNHPATSIGVVLNVIAPVGAAAFVAAGSVVIGINIYDIRRTSLSQKAADDFFYSEHKRIGIHNDHTTPDKHLALPSRQLVKPFNTFSDIFGGGKGGKTK